MITIRCTRSRGPRGFFCLQDVRRGPVNVDVMFLNRWHTKCETPSQSFLCFFLRRRFYSQRRGGLALSIPFGIIRSFDTSCQRYLKNTIDKSPICLKRLANNTKLTTGRLNTCGTTCFDGMIACTTSIATGRFTKALHGARQRMNTDKLLGFMVLPHTSMTQDAMAG